MQEMNQTETPIGLYLDSESHRFIGCLDENQAAAAIRGGYKLFQAGREAAMTPETELAKLTSPEQPKQAAKKGR